MSTTPGSIPDFSGQNLFKVQRGESFTVPDSVTAASPAGISSGLSPSTLLDSKRAGVGGYLYAALGDAAGPTMDAGFFDLKVNPKDVVALSNASPAVLTVNSVKVLSITNTSYAAVLGFYS
jgi:hypothetical protein